MCKKHTRKNVNMQILKSQQKSVLLWKFMLKSVHLIRNNISFYVTTTATETFFCIDNTVIHMYIWLEERGPSSETTPLHTALLLCIGFGSVAFNFFILFYMYTHTNYDTQWTLWVYIWHKTATAIVDSHRMPTCVQYSHYYKLVLIWACTDRGCACTKLAGARW